MQKDLLPGLRSEPDSAENMLIWQNNFVKYLRAGQFIDIISNLCMQ